MKAVDVSLHEVQQDEVNENILVNGGCLVEETQL